jgi:GNAT superfamily N-acetyltransferase
MSPNANPSPPSESKPTRAPTPTPDSAPESFTLRPPTRGDLGHIISRHGTLLDYPGLRFEALVARICADFVDNFDPTRERCWVAEGQRSGAFLGCVFLVSDPDSDAAPDNKNANSAKLRLLLVEPRARGMGLGKRLVEECVTFARSVGYQRVVLWTQNSLLSARRIYEAAGFEIISTEEHDTLGVKMTGETWELQLGLS